jgi:hypothetical protein
MSEDIIPIEEQDRLPKCSAIEKEMRIAEVIDMYGQLKTYKEIQNFLMEKYGLTRKSTEPYLRQGKEELIKSIPDAKEIIARHIKKYTSIAVKNEDQDVRSSMIAMVNIEKLLKLHNPETQINQQFNSLNLEGVDLESIMNAINELREFQDDKK